MKILAIDGSSQLRSAAICRWHAGNQFDILAQTSGVSQHGGRLASLVEEALQKSGENRAAIDRIIVGIGPGSSAGIRSTLAFAIGWSVALATPAAGISSLWTLAARAREERLFGKVVCLLRGTAGKLYCAAFQVSPQKIAETRSLEQIVSEQLSFLASDCDCIVGPEVPEILDAVHSSKKSGHAAFPASVRQTPLLPTASALGWLAHEDYKHLIRPLEPLRLDSPDFAKAPRPRAIPKR